MSYAGPEGRASRPQEKESTIPGRLGNVNLPARAPGVAVEPWPSRTRRRDRRIGLAAGLAIGVAVGAGLAILFAPQSGEDTRHDIVSGGRRLARRGRRLARRGHDAWDDLRDELQDAWRRKRQSRSA
jgi:hypothetical protein